MVLQILLVISGSVEINPGPATPTENNPTLSLWNLDSIPAREFTRITILETLHPTYGFDIFGECESMLSEDILNEDIFVDGYSDIFRSDKPSSIRNGGVCLGKD